MVHCPVSRKANKGRVYNYWVNFGDLKETCSCDFLLWCTLPRLWIKEPDATWEFVWWPQYMMIGRSVTLSWNIPWRHECSRCDQSSEELKRPAIWALLMKPSCVGLFGSNLPHRFLLATHCCCSLRQHRWPPLFSHRRLWEIQIHMGIVDLGFGHCVYFRVIFSTWHFSKPDSTMLYLPDLFFFKFRCRTLLVSC